METVTSQDGNTGTGLYAAAEQIAAMEGDEPEVEAQDEEVIAQDEQESEEAPEGQAEAPDDVDDESSGEDAESEPEAPSYETLEALAEAAGMEIDDFLQLPTQFKAAGEDVTATLADMRASYQKDADYRRKTTQLADERKALETHTQQRIQALEGHAQVIGQAALQMKQMVMGEVNSPELQQLRISNPGEYAAKMQEIQARATGFDQHLQQIAANLQSAKQQQAQELQAKNAEILEAEQTRLTELLPDWDQAADRRLAGYLVNQGVPQESLQGGLTAVQISLAEKARKFDELQKVQKKTRKKVAAVPKVAKPAQGKPSGKAAKMNQLQRNLKKSNSRQDAAKLIEALS